MSKQNPGEEGQDTRSPGEMVVVSGRKSRSRRGGARSAYWQSI